MEQGQPPLLGKKIFCQLVAEQMQLCTLQVFTSDKNGSQVQEMTDTSGIRFSIVIPSYNYAGYLAGAISSVLEQNYPDTEILVIDDASTDNTSEIADTFKGLIKYYRLEKNRGAAGAWSYGLQ